MTTRRDIAETLRETEFSVCDLSYTCGPSDERQNTTDVYVIISKCHSINNNIKTCYDIFI